MSAREASPFLTSSRHDATSGCANTWMQATFLITGMELASCSNVTTTRGNGVNTKNFERMLAACLLFNFASAGATIIIEPPTTLVVDDVLNDKVEMDDPDAKLIIETGGEVRGDSPAVRVRSGQVDITGTGRVV